MVPAIFPRISSLSRRTKRVAIVGSLGYVVVLLASFYWGYYVSGVSEFVAVLGSVQVGPWLWWALLGGAVVGAVLTVAFVRYRLVSPVLVVALVYAFTMYRMWLILQPPNTLFPPTPLGVYLIGWPLLLGMALVVGRVESTVRKTSAVNSTSEAS